MPDFPEIPSDFPEMPPDFRSGFVALLGEPNVGKSTLMNALLDFKVSIVSSKPQTTCDRVTGIYTDDACQIAFLDTPGIMEPRDRFNEALRDTALESLDNADVVCHLIDAGQPHYLPPAASKALTAGRRPVILVINKSDRVPALAPLTEEADSARRREAAAHLPGASFDLSLYEDIRFVSALERRGLGALTAVLRELLPVGPLLYDPDQPTDANLRFLASEIVREKVLSFLEEEVPYAVAARTEEFVERPEAKHFVRVVIYVEHESQKGIVIGNGGEMLRRIGGAARPEIEALADHPVYLELWVKVRHNWRKRESDLRDFGYRTHATRPGGKRRRHN
jgi:GTP-binding protein Era